MMQVMQIKIQKILMHVQMQPAGLAIDDLRKFI